MMLFVCWVYLGILLPFAREIIMRSVSRIIKSQAGSQMAMLTSAARDQSVKILGVVTTYTLTVFWRFIETAEYLTHPLAPEIEAVRNAN